MAHVREVKSIDVFRFEGIGGAFYLVHAVGDVATSGWSDFRLAQRFNVMPPADGLVELDFEGDPPNGRVVDIVLQVSASAIIAVPEWAKGVKVYAASNNLATTDVKRSVQAASRVPHAARSPRPREGAVLVSQDLVSFDDSFNVIGVCGGFHAKMKKLHHTLTLSVEGPDEGKIRNCISEAAGVGLVAAIVAVYATGGGALSAAVSAFIAQLEGCLGGSFSVRIDNRSHWVEWCT